MREPSRGERAQLSLSVLEAAIGVVFVFAVVYTVVLGVPTPERGEPQLDTYADDVATVLTDPASPHRLSELTRSRSAFERGRAPLQDQLDQLLPDNLMVRIETPHGSIGYRAPPDVAVGRETIPLPEGRVRILVWYT